MTWIIQMLIAASSIQQPAAPAVEMTPAEQAFQQMMTDVVLEGYFTVGDSNELHADRYEITSVTKVKDDLWRIAARVQYNKKDFPVTVNMPVFFAGDTPVMSLTRQGIQGTPGLFDTRLVFFKGGYAGTWGAGASGGKMFGNIVKKAPKVAAQDHAHELGRVTFPTSCKPAVQGEFETGVAMLHSYWFNYAGKTFRGVLEQDPGCAMAYWGIALDMMGNTLSSPPSMQAARAAWELLEKARGVEVKTARERMWLDAARAYFRNYDTLSVEKRLENYNDAMRLLAEKHPDDFEARVYYALTLQASAPKADLTYANQLKSAAMLERLYAANPQHPGITHYLIHAYDFAPFADKGIPAARRYAGIAPAVPHARHMPAHIYSMVGLWQDSIDSNTSALAIQPDYYHAADFTVYAHLQLAQDQLASALIEKALATPERGDRPPSMSNYTAKVAMPARYVLERADWKAAARLPIVPTEYPMADSLAHFTRGLAMARLGDRQGASREIDAMLRLKAAMEKSGDAYWAARTAEQVLAVSAWMSLADGAIDKAAAQARQAADGEEASIKHVAMENRLYPLRELLGDLLLEAKRPKDAYAEYLASLKQYPNRFRALYGAARAAEAAGDAANAALYYRRVIDLAAHADAVRPEVQQARAYVERR